MKITRNSKGVVKVNGKKSFSVPTDRSMFSVIVENGIINGTSFKEDGFVYLKNKPIKKWYISLNGVKVWEPILQDISKLEKRYRKQVKAMERNWKKNFSPAFDALYEVGSAHTSFQRDGKEYWWLYGANDGHYGKMWGFKWVEPPKDPINLQIGDAFYKANKVQDMYIKRVSIFKTVLKEAISKKLWGDLRPSLKDVGTTLQLVINGRIYWYYCGMNGPTPIWVEEAWPEDKTKIVKIGR